VKAWRVLVEMPQLAQSPLTTLLEGLFRWAPEIDETIEAPAGTEVPDQEAA